ncbi:HNH endonuclease family protein [Thermobifida halotolerans]|uniref:HNH endonuclease family protein n=1 Tax=Thermobifida halotolerans TaxID=483545 RepID=UPI001F1B5563|nr:HNH endonuclease family protein [Thermobifida halotolerans]
MTSLALTGCQGLGDVLGDLEIEGGASPTSQSRSPEDGGADAAEARERLAAIETAEPAPRGDYERDEFGSGWIDTDDNGCSTRNDILARDLDDVELDSDGCRVLSGILDDPYTGKTVEFTFEDPQAVQIDHVVPLSLAWRMGADAWDRDTRVEFANDPGNLLATDGPANREKSDSGPGEWQPHEDFRCSYAVIYIDVLHRYELPASPQDHRGLSDMLDTCG